MNPPEVGQSPDEIFDVVDERDVVVGREFRREIHRRGLLHDRTLLSHRQQLP